MTDEEIDRMMKDAEANAEADKKRKEEVDLRNEVDQAIFATEKTIKETEGKGFDAERDAAQAALDDLKKAQEDNNLDDMKAKLEALNEKSSRPCCETLRTSRSSATSSRRSRRRTSNRKRRR